MATVTDEILTKYTIDIKQPEQAMNKYAQTLVQTEEAGEKAFAGIGEAAESSAQKIAAAGRIAEKSKGQFNALGNSVNQLSRELPAFGVSLSTGFLAISNNLPILFDSINALKAQNAQLAAQGKQTQSILGQVASSVFSLNTALTVGVTLLTLYGKEIGNFIANLFKGNKAIDEAKLRFESLNDAFSSKEVGKAVSEYLNLQRSVEQAQNGFAKKDDVLKKYNDTVGRTLGFAKDLNQAEEILRNNTSTYITAVVKRAAADKLAGEAAQLLIEKTRLESEVITIPAAAEAGERKILEARKKSLDEQRKATIESKQKEINQILNVSSKLFEEGQINEGETPEERKKRLEKERKENEREIKAKQKIQDDANEYFRKQQEDTRQQAGEEIQAWTDDYLKKADERKKKAEDEDRQRRELLGQSVLDEKYRRQQNKATLDLELSDFRTSYDRRAEILQEMRDKNYITEAEYAKAIIDLEYAKKIAALDTISSVSTALGAFAQLLGANTEAGKALAIAQTTIDTYVAAQKAYLSQMQFTPDSPIRATIAAAAAVASGLARVAAISAVAVPKPSTQKAAIPSSDQRGFKDGVVNLDGPGTSTSDSIPVWLSRGESVITARSTAAKSDDLKALNRSVVDYEALLYKKYVKPAVDIEQEKQNQFAANIAKSIAVYAGFNDARIVKAIEKNRPATSKDISKLAESMAKQNRIAKFESNLKQSK